ncbi:MAG: glycosyltransferase 87 family protein [Solirubrobacteraceae bacterium]
MLPGSIKRRPALAAALVVFVVSGLALGLAQKTSPLPLPRAQAVQAALHSRLTQKVLSKEHWTRTTVSAVDAGLARVSFFDGGQIVAQVAVRPDGVVTHGEAFTARSVPYGDWIAYQPALLIGLAALFVLMAGVAPWRRIRNLDVAAALSLVAPMVLLQRRYVDASVLSAVPGLGYLMLRCAVRGLGPDADSKASTPLLDALTAGWDAGRRLRLLRILLAALVLVFVMVTVSSREAVDVAYAVMEGATKLIHGVLPYGHLQGDVIHGDTYPLLSYALYTPLAWISPVQSTWSSVDLALGLAAASALAVAWAVFKSAAGGRLAGLRRSPDREAAGLRAAMLWLAFPPLLAAVSTGTSDVVLAALLAVALVLWRRPALATGLLAAAAWFKLVPLALIPARLATLRGRRLIHALLAIVAISVPMLALLVALGGIRGPVTMLHAISYQFSRGSPQSLWAVLGVQSLQPWAQAGALALIVGASVRLAIHPQWERDTVRVAALAGAILISLQLAANYWAFLYLIWTLPPIALSLLAQTAPAVDAARVPERRLASPQPELVGVR